MQALLEILYTNNLSKSYKESVRYTSVALCAVDTSVTLHYLRPLRDSVCPLYKPFNLSSIFRKNLLLPCYHVLHYPVPCLPLPCTMSPITLLPCLEYPVTMSLITLYHVSYYSVPCLPLLCYHVFHYSVTMSSITLLPCLLLLCLMSSITLSPLRNAKPQKRVDKLTIPRSHTPQNN